MIINFFAPFLIAWFAAYFTPGQSLIDKLFNYLPEWLKSYRSHLKCFKCLSFWITLFMTLNILQAIAFSMLAYIFDRIMMSLKMYF